MWKRSAQLRTHLLAGLVAMGALVIPSVGASPALADAGIRPGDQLAAGRNASCAILDDLTVACWGSNADGLLGRGTLSVQESPGPVAGVTDAAAIAVGEKSACAALLDGSVWCWGDGDPTPTPVDGVDDARSIAVGSDHACAIIADGTVKCWGENDFGQIGIGEITSGDASLRMQVPGGTKMPGGQTPPSTGAQPASEVLEVVDAVHIDAGPDHSCVATGSGAVQCWGLNNNQQTGSDVLGNTSTPTKVADLDDAAQVAAGNSHSCAVTTSGAVKCWGSNSNDGLGVATVDTSVAVPVDVVGVADVVDIAVGFSSTCVIDGAGQRWCWGRNFDGQFGNGTLEGAATPLLIDSTTGLTDISAGHNTVCAQSVDLAVACWGSNFAGSADGQSTTTVPTPERLAGAAPLAFDVGVETLCVRTATAGLACRGGNGFDLLLNGTGVSSDEFVPTAGIVNVVDVAVGSGFACVVTTSGNVGCWGSDRDGRLGDGPTDSTEVGVVVLPALIDATQVEAYDGHACALQNGEVWCWGDNRNGQIGNAATVDQDEPVLVSGLPSPATDVSVGESHSCAVANGEVWCWGVGSDRQLGNDSSSRQTSPVQVAGVVGATAVVAGRAHTCALLGSGVVTCWGDGRAFGASTSDDVGVPTSINGLTDVVEIEGGDYNTCAIRSDATVACWGTAAYGNNGDGTIDDVATPVTVPGLGGVTALAGNDSMCAAASDGLWCWGRNDAGEAGTSPQVLTPDRVLLPRDAAPAPDPAVIIPAGPARYVDTRSTGETIDDDYEADGARQDGSTYRVRIAGRGDVPVGADAVVVNVTAVRATGTGYATVFPCLDEVPTASSLNYTEGVNLGNEVVAQLDDSGDLCVFVLTETHLTLDVTGYLPFSSPYEPVVPARLVDTRDGQSTIDGEDLGDGAFADGEIRSYSIAGRGGVDDDAAAVVLNVTAIKPTERTFMTLWPCSGDQPTASGLNAVPSVNRANELVVSLDEDGDVCVFVKGSAHLAIDVVGQLGDVSSLRSFSPQRFADTRPIGETIDAASVATGRLEGGETLEVQVAGRGRVPVGATSVVVNVTVAAPSGAGFVTLYPCDDQRPLASSLNYVGGVNGANDVVAQLSSDGTLCAYVLTATHLVLDVGGALSA